MLKIRRQNAFPDYGSQPGIIGMEYAVSIYTQIAPGFKEVLYGEPEFPKIVLPSQRVEANPGAKDYAYRIIDRRGAAGWIGDLVGHNIPDVGIATGIGTIPMQFSAVGAKIYDTDAIEFNFAMNANLTKELEKAMVLACLNLFESATWYGDQSVGFVGALSFDNVDTSTAAPFTEDGTDTEWVNKDADAIIADVNEALTTMLDSSLMVYKPNVVMLPITQFMKLSNTKMALSDTGGVMMSALEYLKRYNSYTAATGKELKITWVRYLKGAGTGGTDRMIVQAQDPEFQCQPVALPYQLRPPVPIPLGAQLVAWQKFGSYAIQHLGSTLYVDGI